LKTDRQLSNQAAGAGGRSTIPLLTLVLVLLPPAVCNCLLFFPAIPSGRSLRANCYTPDSRELT